jgi:hypothetical protein
MFNKPQHELANCIDAPDASFSGPILELRRLLELGQILNSVLTHEERTTLIAATERNTESTDAA